MRLLITGAAGMLGQDVQAVAARAGHEVLALARADLDISDPIAVGVAVERARPDAIINCAAYTKVDNAEQEVAAATAINADGAGALAGAAAAVGAWIVHVSTDYVFDGTKRTGPYVESDPTGPRSVYGSTKLAGELAVAAAAPASHTIVRSSWLFGNGGPCFPKTILRLAASRPELSVVDDQVGSPTYTPHLAHALVQLAELRNVVGLAHVAAAEETSWYGFAYALLAAVQELEVTTEGPGSGVNSWGIINPCTTAEFPLPAPRPAYSVLRTERAGVPLLPDWQTGMTDYLAVRVLTGEWF